MLESIGLDSIESQGYGFQVELAYRVHKQGFRIVETPIVFMDRRVGKSKMSKTIVLEAFTYVLRARFGKSPVGRTPVPVESRQPDPVSTASK